MQQPLNALQTAITEQKRKMSEVIKEFDSKPEKREVADRLRSEMSLVRSRLVWLDSVDGADEKKLASMIQEVIKVGSVNAANSPPRRIPQLLVKRHQHSCPRRPMPEL